MAISPQRLTIYLYSAHRAVIFAIAQLSCWPKCRFRLTFVFHQSMHRNFSGRRREDHQPVKIVIRLLRHGERQN